MYQGAKCPTIFKLQIVQKFYLSFSLFPSKYKCLFSIITLGVVIQFPKPEGLMHDRLNDADFGRKLIFLQREGETGEPGEKPTESVWNQPISAHVRAIEPGLQWRKAWVMTTVPTWLSSNLTPSPLSFPLIPSHFSHPVLSLIVQGEKHFWLQQ